MGGAAAVVLGKHWSCVNKQTVQTADGIRYGATMLCDLIVTSSQCSFHAPSAINTATTAPAGAAAAAAAAATPATPLQNSSLTHQTSDNTTNKRRAGAGGGGGGVYTD